MKTVNADPLFSEFGQQAWGWDCPECGNYCETIDTEKEHDYECDACGEKFKVIYPGEKNDSRRVDQ